MSTLLKARPWWLSADGVNTDTEWTDWLEVYLIGGLGGSITITENEQAEIDTACEECHSSQTIAIDVTTTGVGVDSGTQTDWYCRDCGATASGLPVPKSIPLYAQPLHWLVTACCVMGWVMLVFSLLLLIGMARFAAWTKTVYS
jgi:hypothetical protein